MPGAGTYNPDFKAVSKSLPKYSMKGRSNNMNTKLNVPGPGTYDINLTNKRNNPSFGFGSSVRKAGSSGGNYETPGPGAYKINVKIAETA